MIKLVVGYQIRIVTFILIHYPGDSLESHYGFKSMKILIIGGTRFQGKYLTQKLAPNHSVTVFHRGVTPLACDVEEVLGDRNNGSDLDQLRWRQFDCVVDTCGYLPYQLKATTELFRGFIDKYIFVSTGMVYEEGGRSCDESAEIKRLKDWRAVELSEETYGALKGHCEDIVKESFPDNHLIFRPSVIIGPGDHTERLNFWVRQISLGRVICPSKRIPLHLVDVDDLTTFYRKSLEIGLTGTYNLSSYNLTLKEMLTEISHSIDREVKFVYPGASAFESRGIDIDKIPLVTPELQNIDDSLARMNGFVSKPLWKSGEQVLLSIEKGGSRDSFYEDYMRKFDSL